MIDDDRSAGKASTKERILNAAAELFSSRGYGETTLAEITKLSGVNIALVNYHYGDKATLYRQTWELLHSQALAKYPLYGKLCESAPAVKRLYEIIRSDIARRSDPSIRENDFMMNELSTPTQLMDDLHARAYAPLRAALQAAVAEISADRLSEEDRRMAVLAIFSMCTIPVKHFQNLETEVQNKYDVETRARYVYNFAMAGILDMLSRSKK